MKTLKKLFAMVLSLCLALACAVTAFADDTTGSITIENPVAGQSYDAYRLFDLESFDPVSGAYSYVLNGDFTEFAKLDTIRGKYITLTESGSTTYVKWIDGANAADFAKLAIKWATDNNKTKAGSVNSTSTSAITISGLKLGYYVIDSSLGTLCSLTTTNPDATIKEKNDVPSVEKTVLDQGTLNYGASNTAKIGDTVEFKTVVNIGTGAVNLRLHDAMDACFTLNTNSFDISVEGTAVPATGYTIITTGLTDNDTFEISFDDNYVSTLKADTDIVVKYSAVLNGNAKVVSDNDDNENKTWLVYGDKNSTTNESKTKTLTFGVDVVKTNTSNEVIVGAKFKLYDSETDGNEIKLVLVSSDAATGTYTYRVAEPANASDTAAAIDTITAGKVTIKGLNAARYYLEETEAPSGYNKLTGRVLVNLTGATTDNTAVIANGSTYGTYTSGGVQVINNSGTILPGTGGSGTTVIYIIGGLLIAAAFVFVFSRKRSK